MSFVRYNALNGTGKEVDLGLRGWTFITQGVQTREYNEAKHWNGMDILVVRRHCGGLLILRKVYTNTYEELTLSSARNWLKLNLTRTINGFPELEG